MYYYCHWYYSSYQKNLWHISLSILTILYCHIQTSIHWLLDYIQNYAKQGCQITDCQLSWNMFMVGLSLLPHNQWLEESDIGPTCSSCSPWGLNLARVSRKQHIPWCGDRCHQCYDRWFQTRPSALPLVQGHQYLHS